MPVSKQILKELYLALRDKPLDPADPEQGKWYVPYVEKLDADPINEIFEEISFNDSESLYYVTGQKGTGKSTELRRLRNLLVDSGVTVFYVDMLKYLHMSEVVEVSDFLIAVSAGLAEQAREQHGLVFEEESYWKKLKAFISRIEIEKTSLKASLELPAAKFGTDITARLKADDTFKRRLQEVTRGYTTELVEEVHNFAIALVGALRKETKNEGLQIAVIIDSFEQIRGYYGNVDEVYKSVVRLFGADGKHLRLPLMHTVITIPPYLNSTSIGAGETPVALPSVHVRERYSDKPDPKGIAILLKMVYQRSDEAKKILSSDVLETLAIASGGDIRDFFSLVSSVLVKAGTQQVLSLPLDAELAALAKEKLARSFHPIDDVSTRWLYKVRETQQAELGEKDKLHELALLFDRNLVIHYQNGENWYGIHPLIDEYVVQRVKVLDERQSEQEG